MRGRQVKGTRDMDYIDTLYRMLERNMDMDKIADWLAIQGIRYSAPLVKQTFKKAGREDLIEYFIKEEDIKIGDTVRSRLTGRIGTVKSIKNDGDTILVNWETGGSQLLSKESCFKLRDKGCVKVHTVLDPYGDIK
ncbi:MAG TPA: hypothetical protein P5136_00030 [Methanofastidiosum sp.]|nr:hypothetical protein [Methanofastidiosum sp.]